MTDTRALDIHATGRFPRTAASPRRTRFLVVATFVACGLAGSGPGSSVTPAAAATTIAVTDTLTIPVEWGVTQPLDVRAPLASCSLAVLPAYSWGVMSIAHFDPTTLLPDPATVALRSRTFTPSDLYGGYGSTNNRARIDFTPPLVLRAVDHVAETITTPVAMSYQIKYQNTQSILYDENAPLGVPTGYWFQGTGPRQPLAGQHPAWTHALVPSAGDGAGLWVAQAVVRTDDALGSAPSEYAQRFRVPYRTALTGIECAFATVTPGYPYTPIEYTLYEAADPAPPVDAPFPLALGWFEIAYQQLVPEWRPAPLPYPIMLEPDREYWLALSASDDFSLYARSRVGPQTPDFTAGIGELYARPGPGTTWQSRPDQSLCFRLIGTPFSALDAGLPAAPGSLRLAAAPRPALGEVTLAWAGASGRISLEILDLHGRRITAHDAIAEGAGRWTWNARLDRGDPAPGGIYFARIRDVEGHVAVERVVLIR